MKESISTSYLFTAVIVIIGLCALIIIGGLNFSKAFKIKNRMIEIIEKNDGYNDDAKDEIDTLLKESGYPVLRDTSFKCPRGRDENVAGLNNAESGTSAVNSIDSYQYCVYQYKTIRGYYYSVVAYMQIEIPLLSDFIRFNIPIYGDTKVFLDL